MQRENAQIQNFQWSEDAIGHFMLLGERRTGICQSTRQVVLKLIHSRVKGCCTDLIYFICSLCSMAYTTYHAKYFGIFLHCSVGQKKKKKRLRASQEKDEFSDSGRKVLKTEGIGLLEMILSHRILIYK